MTFSTDAKGVYAIAATPFHDDGSIDFDSVDRLTDFYQESGCTGITILGIMGEAPKLEPEESRAIIKRRGVIASDAQRKPAQMLSPAARAEVDYLLARLARHDTRAAV